MPANTCFVDTLIEYIEKTPVPPGELHNVPEGSDFYIARARRSVGAHHPPTRARPHQLLLRDLPVSP